MASVGHSDTHRPQSMHWSGLIATMFTPSWKHSTGHTAAHSVYLQLIHGSQTTWGMIDSSRYVIVWDLDGTLGDFTALHQQGECLTPITVKLRPGLAGALATLADAG